MLNQFVLRNYRLFKNETLLDFFPAPINEHKASLLTAQGDGESFSPCYLPLRSKRLRKIFYIRSTLECMPSGCR